MCQLPVKLHVHLTETCQLTFQLARVPNIANINTRLESSFSLVCLYKSPAFFEFRVVGTKLPLMVDPSLPSLLNWAPLYLRSLGISRMQLPPGDQLASERNDWGWLSQEMCYLFLFYFWPRLTLGGGCNGCSTSVLAWSCSELNLFFCLVFLQSTVALFVWGRRLARHWVYQSPKSSRQKAAALGSLFSSKISLTVS